MIFDVLKQRWLRKEFRNLENSSRDHQQCWPKSLVIIFDADRWIDLTIFEEWCQKLNIPFNCLTLVAFTRDVKKKAIEGVTLFDNHSIRWAGGLKDPKLSAILGKKYDLQINYLDKPSKVIKYVMMKMDSNLKVGYASHEEITYDLAVNVPLTKQELFISEIAKYLKIFNP
ncbi:MAG: hypothetical protein ABF274_07705 [Nonlabens sp.]|uniref:DUF6913 domain-containing protein n=1 Tax=Nonlabens sp. TaxID=1888209 RepID=UPI003219B247